MYSCMHIVSLFSFFIKCRTESLVAWSTEKQIASDETLEGKTMDEAFVIAERLSTGK